VDEVVIAQRRTVAGVGFAHWQIYAPGLHFSVGHAPLPDVFVTGALKKVEVFCIINYTHGIGFAVRYAMGKPGFGLVVGVHVKSSLISQR
jgi:hypothetical protein